jgi:hypothetical protein
MNLFFLGLVVIASSNSETPGETVHLDCERQAWSGPLRELISIDQKNAKATIAIPDVKYVSESVLAELGPAEIRIVNARAQHITDTYVISRTSLTYSHFRQIGSGEPPRQAGTCKITSGSLRR